ncbi:hypothetical protein GH714_037235 [Hevea brasiliensis]|uniref:protein-serine/threonine phosphatase n=1 Tax=Hevea brasiliensis TaxID=3981 RepID=A0A6A6L4K9_HEVBR|nr:hypothetical protein GH714_037235 [Hevea brasiliensis]
MAGPVAVHVPNSPIFSSRECLPSFASHVRRLQSMAHNPLRHFRYKRHRLHLLRLRNRLWLFVLMRKGWKRIRAFFGVFDGHGGSKAAEFASKNLEKNIMAEGGYVDCCHGVWRIQGSLAVTRGIGDRNLKQWVVSEPETKVLKIKPDCEFLILASDGSGTRLLIKRQ